jgi:hypothetical protein
VATVATVFGVALTFQVRAGADKVAFPDNYAMGVMYLSLDKPESKQVHQIYAMPESFAAARKDQPMPSGTVFTVVRYAAQLDAQGNPVKGADGQFVKGELLGYAVMEKRTGWGSEYPDTLRNGFRAPLPGFLKCVHSPYATSNYGHNGYESLQEREDHRKPWKKHRLLRLARGQFAHWPGPSEAVNYPNLVKNMRYNNSCMLPFNYTNFSHLAESRRYRDVGASRFAGSVETTAVTY